MNRFLKTLLLWLLLAALPVQGMAAAAMAACGSGKHHGAAPVLSTAHHQHEASMAMSTQDMDHVHTAPDPATHTAHHGGHGAGACGACVNCCAGAVALSPALIAIAQRAATIALPAYPSPLVTSFIPSALERPPKRLVV
jgi:hypothetical protein